MTCDSKIIYLNLTAIRYQLDFMSLYVITKLMILSYIIAYHITFPTFNYCVVYSSKSLSG